MKYFKRTCSLALIVSFFTISAYSNCVTTTLSDNHKELVIHGQKVVLLGWEHITDEESNLALSALVESLEIYATTQSCTNSAKPFDTFLRQYPHLLSNYELVYSNIKNFIENNANASIGVEQTEAELQNHSIGLSQIYAVTQQLRQNCPSEDLTGLNKFIQIISGPDHYAAASEAILLIALENQAIKDKNRIDFENEHLDTFDYDNPAITDDGQKAIVQIREAILNQSFPTDDLLYRVIAFETDKLQIQKLFNELKFSIQRGWNQIQGAFERNQAMVEKILEIQRPMIIPIGFYHVNDLETQILNACSSQRH
jgi:hypothetical protein